MISHDDLRSLEEMAKLYFDPPYPRTGNEAIALRDALEQRVINVLPGLLLAARKGVGS